MPLQGGLLLAALPNLYLNESPVNYVTDGNALSTYLISQEFPKMDKTLMAIQTKFTIATFIGDEKMFREAVDAYKKWILILKLRSSKSIHYPLSCFPNQPGISRAIFSQLFQEFSHERLLHSGSS